MKKIYFLDINTFKQTFSFEEIYNKVSLYRKEKVDKLIFEKDKWLSLGVEYLLIKGLEEIDIDYSKIEIGFTQNNKPILMNSNSNIYFNLSHSNEMAMCVISDCEIGCDIQKLSYKDNYLEIAERFFHNSETEMLKGISNKDAIELFYRIWVLKESYIKATGKGLQTPLNEFRICFENNNPTVYVDNVLQENYVFEEIDSGNLNYKCAICIRLGDDH